MRLVTFIPEKISIQAGMIKGLKEMGHHITNIDWCNFFNKNIIKYYYKVRSVPKVSNTFGEYLKRRINYKYEQILNSIKPDLVIVYNDMFFDVETIKEIKKKICPVICLLGDNPFFLGNSTVDLSLFFEMSKIYAPDSYWVNQLSRLGIKNIDYYQFGYDDSFFGFNQNKMQNKEKYQSDLIYIGENYAKNWGFKKCKYLSSFSDFNMKIIGRGWDRWYKDFPDLKYKVIATGNLLQLDEIKNYYFNSKIAPIENNPGVVNGFHHRFFEVVSADLLPIIEYSKDLEDISNNLNMPMIKCYKEGADIVKYYLENEFIRKEMINNIKRLLNSRYHYKNCIANILDGFEF